MSVFVERVDVDRAWEVYYQLADCRHKDGLTIDELRQVIDAALVGVVKAEEDVRSNCREGAGCPCQGLTRRFVSQLVEVEEHQ